MPTGGGSSEPSAVFTPSLVSEAAGDWTAVDITGAGTVAVASGEAVTTIPNGSVVSLAGGKVSRAWPASGRAFELIARVQFTGDTNAEIEAVLRINYAVGYCYWILKANGVWQFYSGFDGVENDPLLISSLAVTGMPIDGTAWTCTRINGQHVTLWTGIGVGENAPASGAWTLRFDADRPLLLGKSQPTAFAVGGRSNGTHPVAGTTTTRWSKISARNIQGG